ncbi:MipA/OmpV family protein [Serratia odorifera]|uniref:MipA/OmpV family protein n=1 Tax=Serratia odorifera TaxID=618 RepID=UPI0018E8768D|nr:MipA/OmpV family protein [Serratia odorifera]MBJ2065132.1 MipA/OmpV family protein [Serratia odorifera]
MYHIKIVGLLLAITIPLSAFPNSFSFGIQTELDAQAYKAKHTHFYAIPYVDYDNDTWYIDGIETGFYLLKDAKNEVRVKAYYYYEDAYRPEDGHGEAMKILKKRHATIMSGISYQRLTPWGAIFTQVAADTLNNSKGVIATVAYIGRVNINSVTFYSELGTDWSNTQQTRYYYGISKEEAENSGLNAYRPHQSLTPFIMLATEYKFTKYWDGYIESRYDFLSRTVRNSPMVDRKGTFNIVVGLNYNF